MKQTLSVRTNRPMTGAKKLTEDDFLKLAVKQIEKKDCHGKLKIIPLAGDASLRRYFRVQLGGVSRVLMLAKPFNQDSSDFLLVRQLLEENKVPVPTLFGVSDKQGAIFLEDLGDATMLHALENIKNKDEEMECYKTAVRVMLGIHQNVKPSMRRSKKIQGFSLAFDEQKLMWEVNFTMENFFQKFLKRTIAPKHEKIIQDSFVDICRELAKEPRVFTHRDFHSRNLMVVGVRGMITIDFQDARMGLRQYDLASLLRDSYYQLDEASVYGLVDFYSDELKNNWDESLDKKNFVRLFDLMSVQRNFKAIGSFASFYVDRGNPGYLRFIGNTFENIRRNLFKFPEYRELRELLYYYYYF